MTPHSSITCRMPYLERLILLFTLAPKAWLMPTVFKYFFFLKGKFPNVCLEFHPSSSPASVPLCFRQTALLVISLLLHMESASTHYDLRLPTIHASHSSFCPLVALFCCRGPDKMSSSVKIFPFPFALVMVRVVHPTLRTCFSLCH